MKKIYVMIGNYGSGKSELALNFAFKAAETGKTELIDLDLVNTYFRLTERGKLVEQKEIRLISPNYACSGVETLSLPAEVASAFAMNWDTVVFDVGGDAVGSTALGRYYEDFQDFMAMGPEQLEVLNVVNIRRPLAGTVEKIIDLQEQMQICATVMRCCVRSATGRAFRSCIRPARRTCSIFSLPRGTTRSISANLSP